MYKWLQRYTFSLENVWKIRKMRMKKKKVAEKFGGVRKKQYLCNRYLRNNSNAKLAAPLAQLVEQLTLNQWV